MFFPIRKPGRADAYVADIDANTEIFQITDSCEKINKVGGIESDSVLDENSGAVCALQFAIQVAYRLQVFPSARNHGLLVVQHQPNRTIRARGGQFQNSRPGRLLEQVKIAGQVNHYGGIVPRAKGHKLAQLVAAAGMDLDAHAGFQETPSRQANQAVITRESLLEQSQRLRPCLSRAHVRSTLSRSQALLRASLHQIESVLQQGPFNILRPAQRPFDESPDGAQAASKPLEAGKVAAEVDF